METKPYKIWAHVVWCTQKNSPLLTAEIRKIMIKHILTFTTNKEYYIACMNGGEEHLHCLLSYSPHAALTVILDEIKTESARWLNTSKKLDKRFGWQQNFAAFSVSQSKVKDVKKFIAKQEDHHQKISFALEWQTLLDKHGV